MRHSQSHRGLTLTQLAVSDAHITLEQVIHFLDGLFLKCRGLEEQQRDILFKQYNHQLLVHRSCRHAHQLLHSGRPFRAKTKGSSAGPQLNPWSWPRPTRSLANHVYKTELNLSEIIKDFSLCCGSLHPLYYSLLITPWAGKLKT